MSEALILVVAVGFAVMGLAALANPRQVLDPFGVAVETPEGRNEVRAIYGGFGLAVTALLAVAALGDPATAEGIVVAVAFALLGMAGGRVVSGLFDRPRGVFPVWVYFAIEVVSAGLLFAAVW